MNNECESEHWQTASGFHGGFSGAGSLHKIQKIGVKQINLHFFDTGHEWVFCCWDLCGSFNSVTTCWKINTARRLICEVAEHLDRSWTLGNWNKSMLLYEREDKTNVIWGWNYHRISSTNRTKTETFKYCKFYIVYMAWADGYDANIKAVVKRKQHRARALINHRYSDRLEILTLLAVFAFAVLHWQRWPQHFKAPFFFFFKLNTSFFVHHPPHAIGWPLTSQLAAPFLFPVGCDKVSSHPGLGCANAQRLGRQRSNS